MSRTKYLLELEKHNVKAYIANSRTKAAMVAGSVAEGLCDEYSDCDMSITKKTGLETAAVEN